MNDDRALDAAAVPPILSADTHSRIGIPEAPKVASRRARVFWALWYTCTALLIISLVSLVYSAAWEFSTRTYLKGFSDAIVPANAKPVSEIQAILSWMSGPAAEDTNPSPASQDRNPEDTLNYSSLLKVCGTATNAFINLASSAGLSARRLLLLDSNGVTIHVVAEVFVDGRWIIVDPAFRLIPRGPDGALLTRQQLSDPRVLITATRNVPNYDPSYSYQITTHVHMARIPYIGKPLRRALNALVPGWSNLPEISLLLERSSLGLLAFSIVLVLFASFARFALRWYAAARLDRILPHVHRRFAHACMSFFKTAV